MISVVMARFINTTLVLLFLFTCSAFAEQRELYTTSSYIARGKAMVADVDDYNVMFVNPAGMPLIKTPILDFEFILEGSNNISQNLTALFGTTSDKYWKITDPAKLAALNGQNTRARIGFLAAYVSDFISFAFITNGVMDDAINTSTGTPKDTVFSAVDIAFQSSIAKSFFEDKRFRIGATGKAVYRGNRFGTLSFAQLSSEGIKPYQNKFASEGLAFSMDLGTQYTVHYSESELSFGLAALDLCTPFGIQTKFLNDGNPTRPQILPARVDVGIGYKVPDIFYGITLRTNLDIIKSATKMESSFKDMLHMGVEFKFPQFLSLRAGLNQLYWTAGVGVTYWILDASFATYSENTGIYDQARTPADRRYVFQFGFYF